MSEDLVPSIFLPRVLRSGIKFLDLSDHLFSIAEKSFLCAEMEGRVPPWDYQVISVKAISRRYKIHKDGLRLILRLSKYDVSLSEGKCVSKMSQTIDGKGVIRIAKQRCSSNFDPCRENHLIIEEIRNTVKRKHKRIFG